MNTSTMLAGTAAMLMAGTAIAQTAPAPMQAAPAAQSAAPATGVVAAAPAAGGGVAQGATVSDPQGGSVGTIESVDGDFVVLATAKSKVRLPKSSFAVGANGPVIAMTAAQIDQAAQQAAPAAAATAATKPDIAKGAAVVGIQGGAVGSVSEVDAQFATVDLASGGKVRLPVNAFAATPDGKLRIAMTVDQLTAAASASGAGSPGK